MISALLLAVGSQAGSNDDIGHPAKPRTVRDILWVWGNPELAEKGKHSLATFREAGPAERGKLLGVPNVVMAGAALPDDEREGERLTQEVSGAKRLVWETRPDGPGIGPPFVYKDRMAQVRRLAEKYPQIEGVLMDDMSTGKIDRGFKPEHIHHIRQELGKAYPGIGVWGVVYSMSLRREGMSDYLKELDVINLWVWDAKDVVKLEKYVANVETAVPGKPIVLGLYLYDYGGGREFPLDLLDKQLEIALKLARAGRIQGIVFLTIHNDPKAVSRTADWIKRVGKQILRPPADQSPAGARRTSGPVPAEWPAWVEGHKGTILRATGQRGMVVIERSLDQGLSWQPFSTIRGKNEVISPGYFTRLENGSLLLTLSGTAAGKHVSWVSSEDNGLTWSAPVRIMPLTGDQYAYGPIIEAEDGRWAYCPYYERHTVTPWEAQAMVLWSGDHGRTWSEPISFATPEDGNQGLTECTVAQIGPRKFVAAIRADEAPGNDDAFDGFYLSNSEDGLKWSTPVSFGERGRMPLFYRLGDLWALTYRLYDAATATQRSAVRLSVDGEKWSGPFVLETGVDAGPQLVRVGSKTLAFNNLYPDVLTSTCSTLIIPDWIRRDLSSRQTGE